MSQDISFFMPDAQEKPSLEDTSGSLTLSQARLLHRLMYSEGRMGFAEEKGEHNPIAQLHKLGLAEKMGRVGTRHRWQVPEDVFSQGRKLVKEIVAIGNDGGQEVNV